MMNLPQVLLAFMCVMLGIVPFIGFDLLQKVLDSSSNGYGALLAAATPLTAGAAEGVRYMDGTALFAPFAVAILLGLMFLLAYVISKLGSASRRAAAPWLCGYAEEADCHRYTAHNFYSEIKRYFRWLGGMPHAGHGGKKEVK
jgi:hypothetical protein